MPKFLKPWPWSGAWIPRKTICNVENLDDGYVQVNAYSEPLHPVVREFQELIEGDSEIFMLFNGMFEQIPGGPRYNLDPAGRPQIRDYKSMLTFFNEMVSHGPQWIDNPYAGIPINAMFCWPMGTKSGHAAFTNHKINAQFGKLLDAWGDFLKSPESRDALGTTNDDWLGPGARALMPGFEDEFECDPSAPFLGFTSWDNFFTRKFRCGLRPIASPDNDNIIINPCEAAPYCIARNARAFNRFWIKQQPYSLNHIIGDAQVASPFVGGTVYQAFLSAYSYHRWHSPVSGTVTKAYVRRGTYFSQCPDLGLADGLAPMDSQAYLTAVATRAVIVIEADNPNIGQLCFVAVGMCEVSSCEITVEEGTRVEKGGQIGMFHFGGSTFCLIFNPSTKVDFSMQMEFPAVTNIPVNAMLATVSP